VQVDAFYIVVAAACWLLMLGLALGCARLEGPKS
jgi:hypothetical protein